MAENETAEAPEEAGPSLAYGPNPALSAYPPAEPAYHPMEQIEATPSQPSPHSDHGTAADADQARTQARKEAAGRMEAGEDEPQMQGGAKTGASGEEQLASTPDPAGDAAEGADDPERSGGGHGGPTGLAPEGAGPAEGQSASPERAQAKPRPGGRGRRPGQSQNPPRNT